MRKIVLGLLVVVLFLFIGYKYVYHNHRDIAKEEAAFTVKVSDLISEFETDETKANAKYLDKSVQIKGKITSVDVPNKTVVIDEKIFAILSVSSDLKSGTEVTIQGRLIGFDSLLGEIKLDQTTIK